MIAQRHPIGRHSRPNSKKILFFTKSTCELSFQNYEFSPSDSYFISSSELNGILINVTFFTLFLFLFFYKLKNKNKK